MTSLEVLNEINEYIRDYLRFHNMSSTLEHFDAEVKTKQMAKRLRSDPASSTKEEPRLHLLFKPVW